MPFNPIGGPSGSVLVGGVAFSFGKWRASIKSGAPKVNNFNSGYQQLVTGLLSASISIDGPYDGGNMPLVAGATYVFTLKFNNALSFLVSCIVTEIGPSQDIEDAARLSVSAESSGSFTAAVA